MVDAAGEDDSEGAAAALRDAVAVVDGAGSDAPGRQRQWVEGNRYHTTAGSGHTGKNSLGEGEGLGGAWGRTSSLSATTVPVLKSRSITCGETTVTKSTTQSTPTSRGIT